VHTAGGKPRDMDTATGRLRKRLRSCEADREQHDDTAPAGEGRAGGFLFRRHPGPRRPPGMSQNLDHQGDAAVQLDEVGPVVRHHLAGGDPHHDVE
jgi:hypothetical protein